jgi:hypothetical protein
MTDGRLDSVLPADEDDAIDVLLDMDGQQFSRAVRAYLRGDRREMDLLRHPDVVLRLDGVLSRIVASHRAGDAFRAVAARERTEIIPLVAAERADAALRAARAKECRAIAEQARAEAHIARLRDIRAAETPSLEQRALKALRDRHVAEFIQIKREIRAAEAQQPATVG